MGKLCCLKQNKHLKGVECVKRAAEATCLSAGDVFVVTNS